VWAPAACLRLGIDRLGGAALGGAATWLVARSTWGNFFPVLFSARGDWEGVRAAGGSARLRSLRTLRGRLPLGRVTASLALPPAYSQPVGSGACFHFQISRSSPYSLGVCQQFSRSKRSCSAKLNLGSVPCHVIANISSFRLRQGIII
jgi:hypothetical protein